MNANLASKVKNAKRFDSLLRIIYEAANEAEAGQQDFADVVGCLTQDFSLKDIPYEIFRKEICNRLDNLIVSLESSGLSEHQL